MKVDFADYQRLLLDPETPDEVIASYSIVRKGRTAFSPELAPDPDKVEMTPEERDSESAIKIGNGLDRWRRRARFHRLPTSFHRRG